MLVLRRRRGRKGEIKRIGEREGGRENEVARIQREDARGESAQSASGGQKKRGIDRRGDMRGERRTVGRCNSGGRST